MLIDPSNHCGIRMKATEREKHTDDVRWFGVEKGCKAVKKEVVLPHVVHFGDSRSVETSPAFEKKDVSELQTVRIIDLKQASSALANPSHFLLHSKEKVGQDTEVKASATAKRCIA